MSRSTIETVDPLFLIPGYEDEIDLDYGLPLKGLVAVSVRYNLGETFPATEFFEALERHLHGLGWFVPEFTFAYPPERDSEATTWKHYPTVKPPVLMLEQWWIRADEVLLVGGQCLRDSDGGDASRSDVYINLVRYYPAEAERKLNEYQELHGVLPSAQADAPSQLQNNSATTTKEP